MKDWEMGSDICIGMRRKSGEIISALSYSHVFGRILIEADLATPNEDELAALICEYRDRKDYGPMPTAPFGSGILFLDFVSGTAFDGQSISWFPAFRQNDILRALFDCPDRFDAYVPHFDTILTFGEREELGRIPDIVSTRFPKPADRTELWKNAALETVPGVKSRYENGEEIVIGRAEVPRGDFLALTLDLPAWKVVSIDPQSIGEWEALKTRFQSLALLDQAAEAAWDEYVAKLKAWAADD
jgi:hypothetical protein